jgi:hypothetical protein
VNRGSWPGGCCYAEVDWFFLLEVSTGLSSGHWLKRNSERGGGVDLPV